ncbi:glycoside hydrolase family 71/99-like protein [Akkermansiaceae bacterium]|nr:glycoside hydrolase family 71/99-like protein [Akkermansiaceae bacterium]MDB4508249.1 glycoside hydrolase family 71/99-like protein [Akkermansiaceae bacterium]
MKSFLTCLAICLWVGELSAQQVGMDEAYGVLKPVQVTELKKKNPIGIKGRVMTGYQGWFRAEGDGAGIGFYHYEKGRKFEPGHCTIDLWPDLSEFDEDEKFDTPFKHEDGSTAQVFSSVNPKTVNRHFKWMADYGIDGAFVQRFGLVGAKEYRSYNHLKSDNQKLMHCRAAANANGRAYALMYDLSGLKSDDFERLARDWKTLRAQMKLGVDPNDQAYLQHNGKPLVAIWGVGFEERKGYDLTDAEKFIRLLKHNPEWGGVSIMLGVPFGWREQERDAISDERFHEVLELADIISPWSIGRYHEVDFKNGTHVANLVADQKWCERNEIDYLPVVYPGFSWHNLTGEKLNSIPRQKGKFLWDQFVATRAAGIDTAYVAMFDEVDEATAIFKVTDHPPVGKGVSFLDNEGLPSDHYLKITQKGGKLLRGEVSIK